MSSSPDIRFGVEFEVAVETTKNYAHQTDLVRNLYHEIWTGLKAKGIDAFMDNGGATRRDYNRWSLTHDATVNFWDENKELTEGRRKYGLEIVSPHYAYVGDRARWERETTIILKYLKDEYHIGPNAKCATHVHTSPMYENGPTWKEDTSVEVLRKDEGWHTKILQLTGGPDPYGKRDQPYISKLYGGWRKDQAISLAKYALYFEDCLRELMSTGWVWPASRNDFFCASNRTNQNLHDAGSMKKTIEMITECEDIGAVQSCMCPNPPHKKEYIPSLEEDTSEDVYRQSMYQWNFVQLAPWEERLRKGTIEYRGGAPVGGPVDGVATVDLACCFVLASLHAGQNEERDFNKTATMADLKKFVLSAPEASPNAWALLEPRFDNADLASEGMEERKAGTSSEGTEDGN